MVGWTGSDYKFDFDLPGFLRHSLVYFGMGATAVYLLRFALWMVNRAHGRMQNKNEGEIIKEDQQKEDEGVEENKSEGEKKED